MGQLGKNETRYSSGFCRFYDILLTWVLTISVLPSGSRDSIKG
jgi:hypothetical protein